MPQESFDAEARPRPRRRLAPRAWAALGCALLTVLALAALGSCGLLVSNLVDWLTPLGGATAGPGVETIGTAVRETGAEAPTGVTADAIPHWIPIYPGGVPEVRNFVATPESEGGAITLSLSDPLDEVLGFYQDALEEAGFLVQSSDLETSGLAGGMLGASLPERDLGLTLMFSPAQDGTLVVIHHTRWTASSE